MESRRKVSAGAVSADHPEVFRTLWRRALAVGFLALGAGFAVFPMPGRATELSRARADLISETQGFVPGHTLTVALRLTQDPGWHTYWQDPGDAGLATTLDFELPSGVQAGPLEWPKPRVFKSEGDLTCYGYEDTALILVPLVVAQDFSADKLTLKAKATWLVCKDVCLPGKAEVQLSLARMAADVPSEYAQLFAQARKTLGQAPDGYRPQGGAPGAAVAQAPESVPRGASEGYAHLAWMLCLAFLGGLALNLMPCVLPVLSLKALGFVQQSQQSRRHGLALAGAFSAGVFFSFWVLAAIVVAIKRSGQAVGWGFQFQQPAFVLFMAGVILVFSLNLFGLFEIWLPQSAMQSLDKAGRRRGLAGAFGQGLVMTLLATPCTAPFLGTALGFAFAESGLVLTATFTAVALGLALPYLILALVPGSHAWLPKPGAWMLRFKEAMGFLLLATVVWLLWLLGGAAGVDAQAWASVWLLLLALVAWLVGRFAGLDRSASQRRWVIAGALALAGASSVWLWPKVLGAPAAPEVASAGGQAWSPEAVDRLRAEGKPVFVDFSAQWCWTCKLNEKGTLASSAVQEAFRSKGVVLLKADWTRQDPAITAALSAHGRSGVPMYLYYPPHGEAVLLPELLTPALVLKVLESAS
jgi:thiol:disulfide interchange protein